jgi:hypothetical protein
MRNWLIFAALLSLAACIPSSGRRASERPAPRPGAAAAGPPSRTTLQCLADLRRDHIGYKSLPDRTFAGGCSAIGSVQLLDIGTPVTNLGAMTCGLAQSFALWTRDAVQPAARAWLGTNVTRIESFGTYSCRSVNSQIGGRLSEHGRANAVDIAAFMLADGRRVTVLDGWNGGNDDVRKFLRAVHQAGCRRFKVALGPDANALHRDHFHFDLGAGPYCR